MNKHIERIKELSLKNVIRWKLDENNIIKYSKRLRGEGLGLIFVIRKSIRASYVMFKNKNDWAYIKANREEVLDLYRYINNLLKVVT